MPRRGCNGKKFARERAKNTPHHGAALCRNCKKGIPFNDQALVKHIKAKPRGKDILRMNKNGFYPVRIKTSYRRYDRLPSLPGLESSARRGCAFCTFLRQAIQMKRYLYIAPVKLEYEYLWEDSKRLREPDLLSLSNLIVQMTVLSSAGSAEVDHSLIFAIGAKQGTHVLHFQKWQVD